MMRRLLILTLLASAVLGCGTIPDGSDGDLGDGDGDTRAGGDGDGSPLGEGSPDAGHTSDLSPVAGEVEIELPGEKVTLGEVLTPCDITAGAAAVCGQSEPLEPNDLDAPADISLSDGCYVLNATFSETDGSDAVRWTSPRHDPMRVGIAYSAEVGSNNDLNFVVNDATGLQEALRQASRSELSEEETALIVADKNGIYSMEAYTFSRFEGCQPYRLYVDTRWCTDSLEDNDILGEATELDLETNARYDVNANLAQDDDDFFRFVTQGSDPVLVELVYTASSEDTLDLGLEILDFNGGELLSSYEARTGAEEDLAYWIKPVNPKTVYNVMVTGSGQGCVPYKLIIDRNVCSDTYEDNDTADVAKPIPPEEVLRARVLDLDEDYYDLSAFASAECSVSFEPHDSTEGITLVALDADGNELMRATAQGSTETLTASVDLHTVEAQTLAVIRADDGGGCVTYNLRCTTQ
jgi:hypothetical protein